MSAPKIKSIQCTNCGAPLSLHGGGHKIQTLNCQYCGSVLDAKKEFKVLATFSEQQPPLLSPLQLGMQGELKGVIFTVIGIVSWLGGSTGWVDYQLFSPTHGYAWLSYEDGHWVFMRRTRYLPNRSMWSLSKRQAVQINNQTFHFFERYQATISYVSGELTWLAKVGDSTILADAIDPPYLFEAERSDAESEYYMGEYIEADTILTTFQANDDYPPAKLHPLMPYRSKWLQPLVKASKPFALILLFISLMITLFMQGSTVPYQLVKAEKTPSGKVNVSYEFKIDKPKRLIKLYLNTRQAKTLLNPNITDLQGKLVHQFGTKDTNGRYKISSTIKSVDSQFVVPVAGSYRLNFIEDDLYTPSSNYIPTVGLKITEGYVDPYYFTRLLIISIIIIVLGFVLRWLFESERWALASAGDY